MTTAPGKDIGLQEESKWKACLPYTFLLVFFAVVHAILRSNFGDDLYFRDISSGSALLPWLQERYMTWSSRLVLEGVLVYVLRMPVIVWTIIDMAMLLLLLYSLKRILAPGGKTREGMVLAVLLCCYPFSHMGSAGWVTTTVNYLWPLSLAASAIAGMVRSLLGEHIPWHRGLLCALAAVYACNNELAAVMVLAACMIGLVLGLSGKRSLAFPLAGLLISLAGLLFAFTAPGNGMRMASETVTWMPEFPQLSLLGKLRIGFVSTFQHFVSIPNAVLFLVLALACVQVFMESKDWKKRIVGLAPLLIQVVFSAFFFVQKVFVTKDFRYDSPEVIPAGMGVILYQALLAAAFLGMIVCLIASLFFVIKDKMQFWVLLLSLGAGLATRMSLSLSPTVLASGPRTYLFLYMSLIATAFLLWKKGLPKRMEALFFGAGALGMAYTIADVFVRQSLHP